MRQEEAEIGTWICCITKRVNKRKVIRKEKLKNEKFYRSRGNIRTKLKKDKCVKSEMEKKKN